MNELDLKLGDGRILHVYDTGADEGSGRLPVVWHHGTPNIGSPPAPLFPAAERLGLRWVSYDRPGYGGSTRDPGRDLGSAADLVSSVADALGIERFALMGHSGGEPHALACGALLPDRVLGVVSMAGLAPFDAGGLDWFAGMAASGVDSLRAIELCAQHPGKMWVVRGHRMYPLLPFGLSGPAAGGPNDGQPWHSTPYQALPPVYVQNASLEIAWTRVVRERRTIAGDVLVPFLTEGYEGFDINDASDWMVAERLLADGIAALPALDKEPYGTVKV